MQHTLPNITHGCPAAAEPVQVSAAACAPCTCRMCVAHRPLKFAAPPLWAESALRGNSTAAWRPAQLQIPHTPSMHPCIKRHAAVQAQNKSHDGRQDTARVKQQRHSRMPSAPPNPQSLCQPNNCGIYCWHIANQPCCTQYAAVATGRQRNPPLGQTAGPARPAKTSLTMTSCRLCLHLSRHLGCCSGLRQLDQLGHWDGGLVGTA